MENLFWILEYLKVGFSYSFITFIWPMVIFRKFLKGKSRTFRLGFCVGTQMLLINTVVLMLGWIKLFNPVTINILFWGSFFISAFWNFRPTKKNITRMKNFFSGTYGTKSLVSDAFGAFVNWIKKGINGFKEFMTDRKVEFILLFILLIYAVIYFSYGAFQDTSYGASDLYVHNKWTYELCEGQIFSAGIYPEAMHCFVALQHMTFGIDIFSCLLFGGGIHTFLIFLSAYVLLKNIFAWKYSGHIILTLYLTVDVLSMNGIASMARFQWTLPQEFGYPALFICAVFLLKYLRSDTSKTKVSIIKFWKNDDLLMFACTLGATFAIHFYVTIMLFFVCVAVVVPLLKKLFSKKFLPLLISAIMGMVVSIVPMVCAFATGTKLQGSLYWALGVMGLNNEEDESTSGVTVGGTSDNQTTNSENTSDSKNDLTSENIGSSTLSGDNVGGSVDDQLEFVDNRSFSEKVSDKIDTLYVKGFETPLGKSRAKLFVGTLFIAIIVWIISIILMHVWKKSDVYKYNNSAWYGGYAIAIALFVLFELMIVAKQFGLPALIEQTRLYPFQSLFGYCILIVPVDFAMSLIVPTRKDILSHSLGITAVVLTLIIVVSTGHYHGYLMYNLTRYNSTVLTTKSIVEQMKPESYTIVSSTDEIYQMIGHGYHEELISFVNQAEVVSYHIPTEYVYIFVEKNAIQRNHYNFFDGPRWLGNDKYYKIFGNSASYGKNYKRSVISEDMADIFFGSFAYSIKIYDYLWSRTAIMAKTYVWCQKFNEMYPNELHVFYEDDDFVCYYFKQNPRNLYELAVMDASAMIKPSEYPHPFWPEGTFN